MLVWCLLAACGGKSLDYVEDPGPSAGGSGATAGVGRAGTPPTFAGTPPVTAGAPSVGGSPSFGGSPEVAGSPPMGKAGAPPVGEAAQLAALRQNILGTWIGTMKTPWSGTADCKVFFTFNGDTYSARSIDGTCTALYYGSDDDSPEKTYFLDDITAAGEGQGDITIWFGPGNTNQGVIRRIALGGNGLTFQIFKGDYGPFEYSMFRAVL